MSSRSGRGGLSGVSSVRVTIPSTLMASQRAYLQTPTHWGWRFNMNFRGMQTFSQQHLLKKKISSYFKTFGGITVLTILLKRRLRFPFASPCHRSSLRTQLPSVWTAWSITVCRTPPWLWQTSPTLTQQPVFWHKRP